MECTTCDHLITIERDHRDYNACELMKPHHNYTVNHLVDVVPLWCPRLSYCVIIYEKKTTKRQLETLEDVDATITLLKNIRETILKNKDDTPNPHSR